LRLLRVILKFRIPDFPLGALFVTIMATIALLLVYPDVTGDWFWWALVAVAIVAWAVGAGALGQDLPIVEDQPESRIEDDHSPPDQRQIKISPAIAALIDAINRQGRANRAQEKKEDDAKSTREKVTIFVIVVTAGAILAQVSEMRKVLTQSRTKLTTLAIPLSHSKELT